MKHIKISSVIAGLLIIAAGVLLCLFNIGALPYELKCVIFSWPSLLIAIGFVSIFSRYKRVSGTIMMLLGGFFLLRKLEMPAFDLIYRNVWPIILVIVGVLVLCKAFFGRARYRCHSFGEYGENKGFHLFSDFSCKHKQDSHHHHKKHKYSRNNTCYIDRNYVFGGSHEKLDTDNFKGGEINCVFGGTELDLSNAKLSEGENYLEINLVFGGIVLYVPTDWKIELKQSHFCGGFKDNRPKPDFEVDEKRVLLLVVNAVFGGGEIKCKN
ncbi:MAG: cell wall-active antibiotics response protein [Prevotellaceae bacterium]|nr:cell wall-active antibiotics response protein [Prevotellaceae bacterium]